MQVDFESTGISPGEVRVIQYIPQVCFRMKRLLILSPYAPHFEVHDIRVGVDCANLFYGSDGKHVPLPASMFTELAVGVSVKSRTLYTAAPGILLGLLVKNTSDKVQSIAGAFLGETLLPSSP